MDAIISYEEVLANVKQILRLPDSNNDVWLSSIVLQNARDLSTNETLIIKNCTVEINDSKFSLPKDCKRLLAFRASNSCIPGTFVDFPFFTQCGCNVSSSQAINPLSNLLDIQGRTAYFILAVSDETEFQIAYQAVDTDCEGLVIINEEAYTALSFLSAADFALSYPEMYTPMQVKEWQRKGSAQGSRVRGLAARRKFEQAREQIKQKMNQIINTSAPVALLTGNYSTFLYPTIR